MEDKNKLVLKLIDDVKKQFEKNGYSISQETYEKVTKEFLDSEKSMEEIKIELYALANKKINDLKKEQEKERLKKINIEDYKEDILTIESLDKYGYPNIINSNIEVLSKVDIGHNVPINVKFGNKNGFYKNSANTSSSSLDKFEFIICQIGKMLNVKMAETYKVSSHNQHLGIISENVCNIHETLYMYSQIPKFLNKDSRVYLTLKKEIERLGKNKEKINSIENKYKIPVVENTEDIKFVINSFLEVIKLLKVDKEEQLNIRQDYFNMIMIDFIINNVDRNQNNYGLIISEYGEVKFSPLFDNSTIDIPSMPKGYQQINGFLIDKKKLLNCLYNNYYDDIKDITRVCLYNQDSLRNKVTSLCTSELSSGEQEWFLSKFNENINLVADKELNKDNEQEIDETTNLTEEPHLEEGPKLVRTKPIKNNNTSNNDGKINLVMILLTISLALIVITLIILFKIS